MASKLPWTTPKVQTLYTTSSVGRMPEKYRALLDKQR